jgi:hypothetical protein
MANEATADLKEKIRLEIKFKKEINTFFKKVLSYFSESILNNVPFNIPAKFNEELEKILLNQYVIVQNSFGSEIREDLPQEIQSSFLEDDLINDSFQSFNIERSKNIANEINETTQAQAKESLFLARTFDTTTEEEVDGKIVEKKNLLVGFELLLVAQNIFSRKILDRIPAIVTTETEVSAETAKLTEVEVLSTQTSSILAGTPIESTVDKTWVSQGDSLVRETHLRADGQTVPSNKPFSVGDSLLMVPGDTSLGASLNEIINCRCAAQYDDSKVIAIRWEKFNNEESEQVMRVGFL